MFNLLPQQQKAIIQKEYSMRKIVVWLGLIFIVLLVSLVLLMPSYLLSNVRAGEAQVELERTKSFLEGELLSKDISNEVAAAIQDATALRPFNSGISPYTIIRIFESKPKTIQITGLAFTNQSTDTNGVVTKSQIVVNGKAVNRESLTSFGKLLESRQEFASVDIPVSSFVKDSNIDFSMTVTLK